MAEPVADADMEEETKDPQDEPAVPLNIHEVDPCEMNRFDIHEHATVEAEHTVPNGGGTHKEFP